MNLYIPYTVESHESNAQLCTFIIPPEISIYAYGGGEISRLMVMCKKEKNKWLSEHLLLQHVASRQGVGAATLKPL